MEKLLVEQWWIVIVILAWSIPWKAVALWKSARNGHLGWFIVLLIFNTLAILDILYIFIFSKWGKQEERELKSEEVEEQQTPTRPIPPASTSRPMIV